MTAPQRRKMTPVTKSRILGICYPLRPTVLIAQTQFVMSRLRPHHFTSEVQCGQRVALIGIVEKQRGHSLVVGSTAAGACSSRCFMVFIALMIRKMQNATIMKSMITLMNEPEAMTGAAAA